jgi:fatty-acyl-CoA synthase
LHPGVHAQTHPDKPAIIVAGTGETTTYGQLDDRSVRLAHLLIDAGLRRGDHIAMLTDNRPQAFEVYWAALRSGLYVTAINWHLTVDEAAYILNDCGATVLVVSAVLGELAAKVLPMAPDVTVRVAFGGRVEGYGSYEEALATASNEPLADQPRGGDMLYSSGTTGRPKGIMGPLPDAQVGDPGDPLLAFITGAFDINADTVYLSPAPVYHAAPLRFCGGVNAVGGTVVLLERFEPGAALAAIDTYRVTHSQWVPTMFVRMLKMSDEERAGFDGSTQKVAIHAAAPCPTDVKAAMIAWWGPILMEYYGGTEGNGLTVITSEQWLAHPGSVGRAVLGAPRICDDDGDELPPGQVGTVYFERDRLPFRYHNDPDKTAGAIHPRHPTWTTIGDIGYLDDEGFLYLTDRKAFTIISGGVNIYPREVEDVLALHPKVADVAVIGVPDPDLGEQVKAVVQPAIDAVPGEDLAAEIIGYVRGRIAGYKVPRSVDFISELPRTPTGKLVKGPLRDRYIEAARHLPPENHPWTD